MPIIVVQRDSAVLMTPVPPIEQDWSEDHAETGNPKAVVILNPYTHS
jgi:hypothetical protein